MPLKTKAAGAVETPAALYERLFVPALVAPWAGRLTFALRVSQGDAVLDVACGTGVFARHAALRAGSERVAGIDLNEGMLAVARAKDPDIDWRVGRAESLPFEDATFDAVGSQFGLMFFSDRVAALREMWRVLRPGGRLAVVVWDRLPNSPAYARLADLVDRHFGAGSSKGMRDPFALGDPQALAALFRQAGIPVDITTSDEGGWFPSLQTWLDAELRAWLFPEGLDERRYASLLEEAPEVLAPFIQPDGSVELEIPAHLATATKP